MNDLNIQKHPCADKCSEFKTEQCKHCLINDPSSEPTTPVSEPSSLIERLGGYEAAKNIVLNMPEEDEHQTCFYDKSGNYYANDYGTLIVWKSNTWEEASNEWVDLYCINELAQALLEYRRAHNIFELNDSNSKIECSDLRQIEIARLNDKVRSLEAENQKLHTVCIELHKSRDQAYKHLESCENSLNLEKITLTKIGQYKDAHAIIYLDLNSTYSPGGGRITVVHDDFAGSAFFSHVGQPTFKSFIAQCDAGYLIHKLFHKVEKWIPVEDGDELIAAVAREKLSHIRECRASGEISKDALRELYDELKECSFDSMSHLYDFLDEDQRTTMNVIFGTDEWWWHGEPTKLNQVYTYLESMLGSVITEFKTLQLVADLRLSQTEFNVGTASPIFHVQEQKKSFGYEHEYSDYKMWIDGSEGVEYGIAQDLFDQLDVEEKHEINAVAIKEYHELFSDLKPYQQDEVLGSYAKSEGNYWHQVRYKTYWEDVGVFLTRQEADWFIKRKQHDYGTLRVFVKSLYWAPQHKRLIQAILNGEIKYVVKGGAA